ncbi:sensor histidine kinase [Candidatus Frankia nodulisporulans]|uniref:sensor histidine kinase n=1 Tax=Candidatus Frankia nodulisporulans TaxID=2060052 RepID=UPI001C2EBB7B|nr:histidine kinase [Candidatus Frankia nodulisporulans]
MHPAQRLRPVGLAVVAGGLSGLSRLDLRTPSTADGCSDSQTSRERQARCQARTTATVITLVVCAAPVGLTVWAQVADHPHSGWAAVDIAAGLVGWALLAALIRAPVPTALLLAALAAFSSTATVPATLAVLHVAARRRLPVALAVAAAGIGAHVTRGVLRPPEGLPLGWLLALVVVAHAGLLGWGRLARARAALLASLEERARRAEADGARRVAAARAGERTRLAREMHDVLAHRLSLLATYAGALQYRPDAPPQALAQAAGVIREQVAGALDELRDVIAVLRDDDEHTAGPPPTLADLPELLARVRAAGTPIRHTCDLPTHPDACPAGCEQDDRGAQTEPVADPDGRRADGRDPAIGRLPEIDTLAPAVGRAAYRMVQVALTNAHRHAPGQPVHLTVRGGPGRGLTLDLVNQLPATPDAPPSPTAPVAPASTTAPSRAASPVSAGSGMGLVGLTEWVRLAGGQLDHQHVDGTFRLHAQLPWPR